MTLEILSTVSFFYCLFMKILILIFHLVFTRPPSRVGSTSESHITQVRWSTTCIVTLRLTETSFLTILSPSSLNTPVHSVSLLIYLVMNLKLFKVSPSSRFSSPFLLLSSPLVLMLLQTNLMLRFMCLD